MGADLDLLAELLKSDDDDPRWHQDERAVFAKWAEWLGQAERNVLTPKRRAWADDAAKRFDCVIGCANEFSAGKIPVGKPVETPAVLRHLPKRPPGRAAQ